ncbi:uncharacterized protein UBRO2_03342 [Ustilago bromivora]|uniref:Uncharacterized protein n=1 Tax=Ustilago bromivora TaxID=307758 RepID=A0A8H8QMJ4_9BASI|nr:uncharacterized protein UBRO2_03342 [Ustilago bromivora]
MTNGKNTYSLGVADGKAFPGQDAPQLSEDATVASIGKYLPTSHASPSSAFLRS